MTFIVQQIVIPMHLLYSILISIFNTWNYVAFICVYILLKHHC